MLSNVLLRQQDPLRAIWVEPGDPMMRDSDATFGYNLKRSTESDDFVVSFENRDSLVIPAQTTFRDYTDLTAIEASERFVFVSGTHRDIHGARKCAFFDLKAKSFIPANDPAVGGLQYYCHLPQWTISVAYPVKFGMSFDGQSIAAWLPGYYDETKHGHHKLLDVVPDERISQQLQYQFFMSKAKVSWSVTHFDGHRIAGYSLARGWVQLDIEDDELLAVWLMSEDEGWPPPTTFEPRYELFSLRYLTLLPPHFCDAWNAFLAAGTPEGRSRDDLLDELLRLYADTTAGVTGVRCTTEVLVAHAQGRKS